MITFYKEFEARKDEGEPNWDALSDGKFDLSRQDIWGDTELLISRSGTLR